MINNIKKITWMISFPIVFSILSLAIENFKIPDVNFLFDLFYIIFALSGLIFMFMGALYLKKHAENPYQYSISKAFVFLMAGAILFTTSAMSDITSEVCFGCGQENESTFVFDTKSEF